MREHGKFAEVTAPAAVVEEMRDQARGRAGVRRWKLSTGGVTARGCGGIAPNWATPVVDAGVATRCKIGEFQSLIESLSSVA
jgi:hypothetical protein